MNNNLRKKILNELKSILTEGITNNSGEIDPNAVLSLPQHTKIEDIVKQSGFPVSSRLRSELNDADSRLKQLVIEYNNEKINKDQLRSAIQQEIQNIKNNQEGKSFQSVQNFKAAAIEFLNYLNSIIPSLPAIKKQPVQPPAQNQPIPSQPVSTPEITNGTYKNPFNNKNEYDAWVKNNESKLKNLAYDVGVWYFDPTKSYNNQDTQKKTHYLCAIYFRKNSKGIPSSPSCLTIDNGENLYDKAEKAFSTQSNIKEAWMYKQQKIYSENLFERLIINIRNKED